jgi:hypothetical protein
MENDLWYDVNNIFQSETCLFRYISRMTLWNHGGRTELIYENRNNKRT